MPNRPSICLRGVRVHNLRNIDVEIPRNQLTVVCGVSGSGKTSLALGTLYAEGQRRYIESFSTYARQFLQRLDKPDCDSIQGIPPAVAVTRATSSPNSRSTIATATEVNNYLQLLFANVAQLICYSCGRPVVAYDPQAAALHVASLPDRTRIMIGFPVDLGSPTEAFEILDDLRQQGFIRLIIEETLFHLSDEDREPLAEKVAAAHRNGTQGVVLVDRLLVEEDLTRITESLETAMSVSGGVAIVYAEANEATLLEESEQENGAITHVDNVPWRRFEYSRTRTCDPCRIAYPDPESRLFNYNDPLGACPVCEGFGEQVDIDMDRVVPDPGLSLREGAIAPWNTPAYKHERDELLALADEYAIPVDGPYSELNKEHLRIVREGIPERDFGGLNGFFAWLERNKYKLPVRVFLARWRSYRTCAACKGQRLNPSALAYQIDQCNLAELVATEVDALASRLANIQWSDRDQQVVVEVLRQVTRRLEYLQAVGLGYLPLNRTLRTLSGGEAQRVALTAVLGSTLVNMLYVLDEPTAGLHPCDVQRLVESIFQLQCRGNSVVVVEHHETVIRRADRIIEIGPGAGGAGGKVVFEGTHQQMLDHPSSLTGDYLSGRRGAMVAPAERRSPRGVIELRNASGNNLKDITVQFPLGLLCLVTGVSGSGKSSLVQDTLYGALCKRKRKPVPDTLPYSDVVGDGQIEDCILIDQRPVSRSPRSSPVTYIKALDPIRRLFAETLDARTRNLTAGHFSYNGKSGRCETCQGDGVIEIDMRFLADISMTCSTCNGARYRSEILEIKYRDRSIADILEMSARQAFSFFRGYSKIQSKLKSLIDVGLDYIGLGRSSTTLSSGEAQRLKLAGFLATARPKRTLFILDEPTTGLHFADIVHLIDCFDALLADGHSLIVVEHNQQLMQAADYLIDMGPDAAGRGGQIVAEGTPEHLATISASKTGQVLARLLERSTEND